MQTTFLNSDKKAWALLFMLVLLAAAVLALILIDKPYRDSAGHDGLTVAISIKIDELCINDDGFCINNDEIVIQMDSCQTS